MEGSEAPDPARPGKGQARGARRPVRGCKSTEGISRPGARKSNALASAWFPVRLEILRQRTVTPPNVQLTRPRNGRNAKVRGCEGNRGAPVMKARQLIGGAAFPPDVLRVIFDAFDDAWAEVGPDVSRRVHAIEAAG